jgi:BirA family biotin operon repressor/biotin-[acetyl-CoA-carboxylase] ligase
MKIINFDEIDSTNTYSKKNIENIGDRTIIVANKQSSGHGRFTRKWMDLGTENIYMSFILKPGDKFLPVYSNLTQYLSIILCKMFEEEGLKPSIRWPNDVLINNKKIIGILCETVMKGNLLKGLVLGVGINLNANPKDISNINQPATALNLELGRNVDKKIFLNKLLNTFFENYDNFLNYGFKSIREEYLKRTNILDRDIKVAIWDKIISGKAIDIDIQGNLLLKLASTGEIKNINMGELV